MMAPERILAFLAVAGAVVTVLGGGGVLGWWWRKQPERQRERERAKAAYDAILGEPEILDRRGEQINPGQPGLVHRVATVEDAVVEFRHALGVYTEVLGRLGAVERDVATLKDTNVKDIILAAERAATAVVSAEMLKLVNERGMVDGEADEPGGEL